MPTEVASHARRPDASIDVDRMLNEHSRDQLPRLSRYWRYYRNAASRRTAEGRLLPAQVEGLPARLRQSGNGEGTRREVVIENDIAWRIHAMVDFMFGRQVGIRSTAHDPTRAEAMTSLLNAVFQHNGGIDFFHNLALLGSIYGHADVLLRLRGTATAGGGSGAGPAAAAWRFRLEVIDPLRGVPAISEADYRKLDAFAVRDRPGTLRVGSGHWRERLGRIGRRLTQRAGEPVERIELWTPERYRLLTRRGSPGSRRVLRESVNRLGRIPVVHIQNLPQPFFYEGLGEVEPLIALQDELNTRLSDRAHRVTMQSFKMYLGKGIDGFLDRAVGPGQMWTTDNPDASIEAFGGDADSPSESAHIQEIREALDKASGVSPVAAGMVGGRVGNLTSENAIRIVLMGLVAKTEKKRTTYGRGIERLCELVLDAADKLGVLPNDPEDRGVQLDWPNPIPLDDTQTLRNAALKREVGVPQRDVLAELGYGPAAPNPASD